MTKPGKKANFRSQFSYCWLSFTLVESFSFLQELKISFEIRFMIFSQIKYQNIQKINYPDCYKNWLLWAIWDICWYQWLQTTANSFVNLFIIFRWQICWHKNNTILNFSNRNDNFSGTFCTPEPDPGSNFRKNWVFIYSTLVKNQTLCFFWLQNRPNIGVSIVCTISNIFVLALEKRCWRNTTNI